MTRGHSFLTTGSRFVSLCHIYKPGRWAHCRRSIARRARPEVILAMTMQTASIDRGSIDLLLLFTVRQGVHPYNPNWYILFTRKKNHPLK